MRAFMAVEVNTELVDKIIEIQKTLAEANAMVKFVEPENLHFTFKFLGDITPEKAEAIIEYGRRKGQKITVHLILQSKELEYFQTWDI